jgi:hypothetical protein
MIIAISNLVTYSHPMCNWPQNHQSRAHITPKIDMFRQSITLIKKSDLNEVNTLSLMLHQPNLPNHLMIAISANLIDECGH